MADYLALDEAGLLREQKALEKAYARYQGMQLKLDMSRGKPETKQLDLSMPLLDIHDVQDASGMEARNYGAPEGMPEAREFFAELLGAKPSQTVVGGNASLQMMYFLVDIGWRIGFSDGTGPWSACKTPKFLCPSPGYDRHFNVTEVFGFELITVPMTPTGPDMDVLEELALDPDVKGMWSIPVYSNPDGYVYSAETVKRLAEMKTGAPDFRIFWDNAYGVHHLTDVEYSCPNILAECERAGHPNRPFMLCSTSKITFAGGGVAALAASEENIKQYISYFSAMSIGPDKLNQLRHVRYLKQVGLKEHMKQHAAIIAPKFASVDEILHRELDGCGDIARWTEPKGGYFISLYTMEGCARRVVELCAKAGVVLTGAGAAYPYGKDPNDAHIRIAPTFPPIEEVQTAAALLCVATRMASVEKLLGKS